MELHVTGGSLDNHRNIPEHILGPISVSIVRGLQYLWSLKIMHRGVLITCYFAHSLISPFSSNRYHLSYDGCLEVRGEIIRIGLCTIVY